MVKIDFALSAEQCSRVYDAIACLGRVSDSVTIEARPDQLYLTALNDSKSAYLSFSFDKHEHFLAYDFVVDEGHNNERFACRILNKALSAAFKVRVPDSRIGDTGLERCEVSVDEQPTTKKHRFNIRMIQRHGVTKIHSLTYESVQVMHALFDRPRAINSWKIHSKMLRGVIEHFGAKTEQLDIYAEEGRVTLTSYTEKIVHGKEVLKQPLQTAVSLLTTDFTHFTVIDNLHIAISVKDFKTMVMHAQTLNATVTAMYSQPSRPLQFSYGAQGVRCEFTLMTVGGDVKAAAMGSAGGATARGVEGGSAPPTRSANGSMLPPARPATRGISQQNRRLGSRQTSTQASTTGEADSNSLFIPPDDRSDRQWDPSGMQDDNVDTLGWDGDADNDNVYRPTLQDSTSVSSYRHSGRFPDEDSMGIAPTQRASQVHGLFE